MRELALHGSRFVNGVAMKHGEVSHNLSPGTNAGFDRDVLTLGFARRAAAYKRGTLIFHDIERLATIAQQVGPLRYIRTQQS